MPKANYDDFEKKIADSISKMSKIFVCIKWQEISKFNMQVLDEHIYSKSYLVGMDKLMIKSPNEPTHYYYRFFNNSPLYEYASKTDSDLIVDRKLLRKLHINTDESNFIVHQELVSKILCASKRSSGSPSITILFDKNKMNGQRLLSFDSNRSEELFDIIEQTLKKCVEENVIIDYKWKKCKEKTDSVKIKIMNFDKSHLISRIRQGVEKIAPKSISTKILISAELSALGDDVR